MYKIYNVISLVLLVAYVTYGFVTPVKWFYWLIYPSFMIIQVLFGFTDIGYSFYSKMLQEKAEELGGLPPDDMPR